MCESRCESGVQDAQEGLFICPISIDTSGTLRTTATFVSHDNWLALDGICFSGRYDREFNTAFPLYLCRSSDFSAKIEIAGDSSVSLERAAVLAIGI